jgi:hypothetical protein
MNFSLGSFMADLTTSSQGVFNSLLPVIYLLLGILMAFWLISFVIDKMGQTNDIVEGNPRLYGGGKGQYYDKTSDHWEDTYNVDRVIGESDH